MPEPETPVTTVMTPSGKFDGEVLEVVAAGAFDGDPLAGERARHEAVEGGDFAGEVAAGEGAGRVHNVGGRAGGDDLTAESAGAGAEVEDVVGVADGFFVVLDDEDGVAEVAEGFERGDEALVVALVEADGGLVENVEDAAKARADLGGEADALAFAAGEGGGVAVEGEIAEADGVEELQALDDFFAEAFGDEGLARGEADGAGAIEGAVHGERGEFGDGHAVDFDGEGFGAEALAVADGAVGGRHVLHHPLAVGVGAGFFEGIAEPGEDAVEAGARGFGLGRAAEEELLLL